jgi:polyhydroxyalkanoate synthesis regulator phasin
MTSQLATDSPIRALNVPAQSATSVEAVAIDQQRSRLIKAMKSQYQLDQQVKFLHLQAEADSLLQQLQSLKQQRQAAEVSSSQP